MTTYNTRNPIGSTDPRDLFDNAENLDAAMNSNAATWTDRLGVRRPTWAGAIWYVVVGDYAAGIELVGYNQIFLKDGEYYRLSSAVPLPYTTTGVWSDESGDFVSLGDANVRGELARPDVDEFGAGMVAFGPGRQYSLDSVGGRVNKAGHQSETNVIIGDGAFDDTSLTGTVGYRTTVIGVNAAPKLATAAVAGGSNVVFGFGAAPELKEGSGNNIIGVGVLGGDGDHNNVLAYQGLAAHPNPVQFNAIGFRAFYSLTTGNNGTAMGESVFLSMATSAGGGDVGFGAFAGFSRTAGGDAHVTGYQAGYSATTSVGSTITGHRAAYGGNANYLTVTGKQALETGGGEGTTATGFQAGRGATSTATFNTLTGYQAGYAVTTGRSLTLDGSQAGKNVTTSEDIVCVGANSGWGLVTKNRSVVIGVGAQSALDVLNCIVLGFNAQATGDGQVVLGDGNIGQIRANVTTITALSDSRDKANQRPLQVGLDLIKDVQVTAWEWAQREGSERNGTTDYGVIAQQLLSVQQDHNAEWLGLVSTANPDRLEATPGKLLFPLIRAVQELAAENAAMRTRLDALENP